MRKDIMSKTIPLLSAALVCLASLRAQGTPSHPDFTGVYYTFNPNAAARGGAAAPPAAAGARGIAEAPPRPVPVIDGREGRPATAPKLTPEYMAKWEILRKSRMSGSSEFDPNARLLSAGMSSVAGV